MMDEARLEDLRALFDEPTDDEIRWMAEEIRRLREALAQTQGQIDKFSHALGPKEIENRKLRTQRAKDREAMRLAGEYISDTGACALPGEEYESGLCSFPGCKYCAMARAVHERLEASE